jgi:hypothetical protein
MVEWEGGAAALAAISNPRRFYLGGMRIFELSNAGSGQ